MTGDVSGRTGDFVFSPPSRFWVYFTLIASWLLDISPISGHSFSPGFLALTITFWSVHEHRLVGMLLPFLFGLLIDVSHGIVLGQHALSYTVLSYGALLMQRRIPWFSHLGQALHVLPLFLAAQFVVLFIRLWLGGVFPGWTWFGQSFVTALLWPLWSMILVMPQRRRPPGMSHEGN